ncbi:hypothetical protein GGX14DRAFT_384590 [Mycena pura]|uniref:Uncharacterized protein n=1 Tax=Mycena pura TaxID=153505 RepID=A0AAD6YVR3_9AGAR|nr:hypothetical protein GGX14DRAFT_384590 [Mycena pura]
MHVKTRRTRAVWQAVGGGRRDGRAVHLAGGGWQAVGWRWDGQAAWAAAALRQAVHGRCGGRRDGGIAAGQAGSRAVLGVTVLPSQITKAKLHRLKSVGAGLVTATPGVATTLSRCRPGPAPATVTARFAPIEEEGNDRHAALFVINIVHVAIEDEAAGPMTCGTDNRRKKVFAFYARFANAIAREIIWAEMGTGKTSTSWFLPRSACGT